MLFFFIEPTLHALNMDNGYACLLPNASGPTIFVRTIHKEKGEGEEKKKKKSKSFTSTFRLKHVAVFLKK